MSQMGQNPTTPSGSACPLPPAPDMTGAWLCAAVGHSTKSLARYPAEAGGTGAPRMEGAMELTLGSPKTIYEGRASMRGVR